jgi:outer membrane protein assembly factor BamB
VQGNTYNPFVVKYSRDLSVLWAVSVDGARNALALAIDSTGSVYITGTFGNRAIFGTDTLRAPNEITTYLAKFDSSGTVLWAKSLGRALGLTSMAVDVEGNLYVTGQFIGAVTLDSIRLTSRGETDIILVKVRPDGRLIWARSDGGPGTDGAAAVSVDSVIGLVITGAARDSASFDQVMLRMPPRQANVVTARYDIDGRLKWVHSPSGAMNGMGRAVAVQGGSVYVAGEFVDSAIYRVDTIRARRLRDLFVAKLDSTGAPLWAKSVGSRTHDWGAGIVVDSDDVYVLGNVSSSSTEPFFVEGDSVVSNGENIVLLRYDSAGRLICYETAGGWAGHSGQGIVASHDGTVYSTGNFTVAAYFGKQKLIGNDWPASAVFVARSGDVSSSVPLPEQTTRNEELSLYPNPSHGTLQLRIENILVPEASVTITDFLGEIVYDHAHIFDVNGQSDHIELPGLPAGAYIVRVANGSTMLQSRLIVWR